MVSKKEVSDLLEKYHYLSQISKGFKSGYNYALLKNNIVVGVCIYSTIPVAELAVGMLGRKRTDQSEIIELSRLCVEPKVQSVEYNITSWFVSRTIKDMKKTTSYKVILSYADNDFHEGTIYKACNFSYYGLTDFKKDFWIFSDNKPPTKHSRGKIKGLKGEWRPRSRKHRFIYLLDTNVGILWKKLDWKNNEGEYPHGKK